MADFRRKPKSVMAPKVLAIDFRPAAIPDTWKSCDQLVQQYITAMRKASGDTLAYQVVKKLEIKKYPVLLDGRQYDDTTWQQTRADDKKALRDSHGSYMMADYQHIIQELNLIQQVESKEIDEVWMFGGPYFGFYESRMVGRGACWCNAPAIEQNCRRFVIMGFNYERDVKEMVHDFGHRAESILAREFNSQAFLHLLYQEQAPAPAAMPATQNDFEQFLLKNGSVHRKPGGANYGQDEIAWVTALKPAWYPFVVDPNKAK